MGSHHRDEGLSSTSESHWLDALDSEVPVLRFRNIVSGFVGGGFSSARFDRYICGVTFSSSLACTGQMALDAFNLRQASELRSLGQLQVFDGTVADVRTHGQSICVLLSDGRVWCWGENGFGQLGVGDRNDRDHPERVLLDAEVSSVGIAWRHACALAVQGNIFCWGSNSDSFHELGFDEEIVYETPVLVRPQVFGNLTVKTLAVAADGDHTCVVLEGGNASKVVCWGENRNGQLGNGQVSFSGEMPGEVVGLPISVTDDQRVRDIALGARHTCLVLGSAMEASVWCFGSNRGAALGVGPPSLDGNPVPQEVKALPPMPLRVSLGHDETCAFLRDRSLRCWGESVLASDDSSGSDSWEPQQVDNLPNDARSVTLSQEFACAVLVDGSVWCAGSIHEMQPRPRFRSAQQRWTHTPLYPHQSLTRTASLASGKEHWCAIVLQGSVLSVRNLFCWGDNGNGRLGIGVAGHSWEPPTKVRGLPGDVMTVSLGEAHSCAVIRDGSLYCWGRNVDGQLGIGFDRASGTSDSPRRVLAVPGTVNSVDLGAYFTCAVLDDGSLDCWGSNSYHQVSPETDWRLELPERVRYLPGAIRSVHAGARHAYAILRNQSLWCWGSGVYGPFSFIPIPEPAGLSCVSTAAVGDHRCAITCDGQLVCWGRNNLGQAGADPVTNRTIPSPAPVENLPVRPVAVGVGSDHTCTVLSDGSLWCFGDNTNNKVSPDNDEDTSFVPRRVSDTFGNVVVVALAEGTSCALDAGGGVACWGITRDPEKFPPEKTPHRIADAEADLPGQGTPQLVPSTKSCFVSPLDVVSPHYHDAHMSETCARVLPPMGLVGALGADASFRPPPNSTFSEWCGNRGLSREFVDRTLLCVFPRSIEWFQFVWDFREEEWEPDAHGIPVDGEGFRVALRVAESKEMAWFAYGSIAPVMVIGNRSCDRTTIVDLSQFECEPPPGSAQSLNLTIFSNIPFLPDQQFAKVASYIAAEPPARPILLDAWREVGQPLEVVVWFATVVPSDPEIYLTPETFHVQAISSSASEHVSSLRVPRDRSVVSPAGGDEGDVVYVSESTLDPGVLRGSEKALSRGASNSPTGTVPHWKLHLNRVTLPTPSEQPVQVVVFAEHQFGQSESAALDRWIPETCRRDQYLTDHLAVEEWLCVDCPAEAFCAGLGAANVTARPGYWRVPWASDVVAFAECRDEHQCKGYERNQLGNATDAEAGIHLSRRLHNRWLADDGLTYVSIDEVIEEHVSPHSPRPEVLSLHPEQHEECAEGHSGTLCHSCADGYYRSVGHRCSSCGSMWWAWLRALGLLVIVLVALGLHLSWNVRGAGQDSSDLTQLFKIVLNHFQTIVIVAGVGVDWPVAIDTMNDAAGSVSFLATEGLSLECLLGSVGGDVFVRLSLTLISPIVLLAYTSAMWAVVKWWRGFSWAEWRRRLSISSIVLAFVVHAPVTNAAFRLVSCERIGPIDEEDAADARGETELRLVGDLDVRCTNSLSKMLGLAIPTMLIVSIGLPLFATVRLAQLQGRFHEFAVKEKLGFLFLGYREPVFFWEAVGMFRKMGLSFATVVLAPRGPVVQVAAALLVTVAFGFAQAWFKPFENQVLNRMELASLSIAVFTLFVAMLLTADATGGTVVATVMVVATNLILLIVALFLGWKWRREFLGSVAARFQGVKERYNASRSLRSFVAGSASQLQVDAAPLEGDSEDDTRPSQSGANAEIELGRTRRESSVVASWGTTNPLHSRM